MLSCSYRHKDNRSLIFIMAVAKFLQQCSVIFEIRRWQMICIEFFPVRWRHFNFIVVLSLLTIGVMQLYLLMVNKFYFFPFFVDFFVHISHILFKIGKKIQKYVQQKLNVPGSKHERFEMKKLEKFNMAFSLYFDNLHYVRLIPFC